MKTLSCFALAVGLVAGSAWLATPAPADAKPKKAAAAPAAPVASQRRYELRKEAQPALKALEKAVKGKDEAAYPAALAAAQAIATTPDEKYVVAKFRLEHGLNANDSAEQLAALEAVIASGAADATEMPNLYQSIGIKSSGAGDWQKAHDSFVKVIELSPDNTDGLVNLAMAKIKLKKGAEGLPMLERAIALTKAAGKPVPEAWYRNALQVAYESRRPQAVGLARETLTAYPTQENWRNALIVYRDSIRADEPASLDMLRLMRVSKTMSQRNEYYDLAISLSDAGLPAEAKAVLDEAVAANVGRPSDDTYRRVMGVITPKLGEDRASLPGLETRAMAAATGTLALKTADAFLGYGDYAKSVGLYRAALAKGGVDASLVNTRLGMALALAGNKAEAETAFKAVTGQRADLAAFWLHWLSKTP